MRVSVRHLIRLVVLCLALGVIGINAVLAQTPAHPNAIVQVFEVPPTSAAGTGAGQPSYLASVGTALRKILDVTSPDPVFIAPDEKHLAQMVNSETGGGQLTVTDLAQKTSLKFAADKGHSVLWVSFSPDGRYLAFTTAASEIDEWTLNLVDLSNKVQIVFAGTYGLQDNDTPPPNSFTGAANVVAWSPDDKRIFVQTYFPFSAEGGFDTLYAIDISNVAFDKPGRYPIPPGTRLIKQGFQLINYAFSPDTSKLAYTYYDTALPPSNDQAASQKIANTVVVMDIATGQAKTIYQAASGKGLGFSFTWSGDGQKFVFQSGDFQTAYFVVASSVLLYDVASGGITQSPPLTADSTESLQEMMACGDTLYYSIGKESNSDDSTEVLYSAPLTDLKAHSAPLASGIDIVFMVCGPA